MWLYKFLGFFLATLSFVIIGCFPNEDDELLDDEKDVCYNIVFVIDRTYNHYASHAQVVRDKYIIERAFDWIENRQKKSLFSFRDKLKIVFLPAYNTLGFESGIVRFEMGTVGYDEFNKRMSQIDSLIRSHCVVSKDKDVFKCGEVWDFFENELSSLVEYDDLEYEYVNKMIFLSNGKVFFCPDNCPNNMLNKCVEQKRFISFCDDLGVGEDGYAGEIFMKVPEDLSFGNLHVLFAEIHDDNIEGKSTRLGQELLMKGWFDKIGIECEVIKAPSTLGLYDDWIKDFFEKRSVKDRIPIPYAGKGYDMSLMQGDELVAGLKGTYWKVNIRDSRTNKYVYFDPGRYELDFDIIKASVAEFCEKVVSVIKRSANSVDDYQIFVRGSADHLGHKNFKKNIDGNVDHYEIEYYPLVKGKNNLYGRNSITKEIGPLYENVDLPDLRANFLKDHLDDLCQFDSFKILEGTVSDVESKRDRNVCLMLYVSNVIEANLK